MAYCGCSSLSCQSPTCCVCPCFAGLQAQECWGLLATKMKLTALAALATSEKDFTWACSAFRHEKGRVLEDRLSGSRLTTNTPCCRQRALQSCEGMAEAWAAGQELGLAIHEERALHRSSLHPSRNRPTLPQFLSCPQIVTSRAPVPLILTKRLQRAPSAPGRVGPDQV